MRLSQGKSRLERSPRARADGALPGQELCLCRWLSAVFKGMRLPGVLRLHHSRGAQTPGSNGEVDQHRETRVCVLPMAGEAARSRSILMLALTGLAEASGLRRPWPGPWTLLDKTPRPYWKVMDEKKRVNDSYTLSSMELVAGKEREQSPSFMDKPSAWRWNRLILQLLAARPWATTSLSKLQFPHV